MNRAFKALVFVAGSILIACAPATPDHGPAQAARLQQTRDTLHARLEAAAAADPLVTAANTDRGNIVVAIRSGLLEEIAGTIARRYLDNVKVDLAEVKANSSGEIRKKTFLGRVKVGSWTVSVALGSLVGQLRAGTPEVSLRAPNMVDLKIPVDVLESTGDASFTFSWDSAGLANVVCDDFELSRGLRGRVLPQRHVVAGALRLENTGATLTATPVFPDRKVALKLDLTPESWGIVEAALRSQDTGGTCGTLMDPEAGLAHLRGLAAKGVNVKLPKSIFRTVRLPASLREDVTVTGRVVNFSIQGESLRIEAGTLWSSASIAVRTAPRP